MRCCHRRWWRGRRCRSAPRQRRSEGTEAEYAWPDSKTLGMAIQLHRLYDIYMRLPALCVLLASASQGYQQEEAREALLSQVIADMRHVLALMPDYTCSETISRSIGDGTPLRVKTL